MSRNHSHLLILAGPSSLLLALILLTWKTAYLIGRPFWIVGLCLSLLISCYICYLSFREMLTREKSLKVLENQKEKEAQDMRALLDEASLLYRDKIDKLEQALAELEEEKQFEISEKDQSLEQLRKGYEEIYLENQKEHSKASSFHVSLTDALDELRALRQIHFFEQESGKSVPKDLPAQHKQLREQFDEKAMILDQTRRRLFAIEGQLLVLKKEQATKILVKDEEQASLIENLQELTKENEILEQEIKHLESLAKVLSTSSRSKAKPKEKVEQMLEFQFDKSE